MKFGPIILLLMLLSFSSGFAQTEVLSLDDCIQIALENNSNIITTKNLNKSAAEDVTGSYAGILPTINVSASSGRFKQGPRTDLADVPVGIDTLTGETIIQRVEITQPGFRVNFNNLSANVNQNIFDGGEWWNAIKYANSQKRASDLTLKSTINTTVLSVQQNYFELLKHQKLLEVYKLAVQRSQDQRDKTQKMFELGAVAKVDVFRSQVNLGNDKIQLLLQQNAVISAINDLNLVMGRDPKAPLEIQVDLKLGDPYTDVEGLYQKAIENNPDLQVNEEIIVSDKLSVARSKSVLYPRLGAFFNYNRSNEQLERVYSDYNKNWSYSVGLSFSLNLFNGFRDKVNIQKAKLLEKNTLETYESNKRNLRGTVVRLIDNYNSYLEIIELNEDNLDASKEEFRLAEERYRIGSGTQLEVREAQVNLTRAEQTLVAAQYNARITQAQLEQALGSIYAEN